MRNNLCTGKTLGLTALFLWNASCVLAQSDILVSKGIGSLMALDDMIWAFDLDALSYSRLDFFTTPPRVYTTSRESGALSLVVPVGAAILGLSYEFTDTTRTDAILQLEDEEEQELFSFSYYTAAPNLAEDVRFTGISATDSLAVVGYGKAGFTIIGNGSSGGERYPDPGDSLTFWTLTTQDSVYGRLKCADGEECSLKPLEDISHQINDSLVSVDAVALDRIHADSLILFLGSNLMEQKSIVQDRGLRRGLLGGNHFPRVASMGLDTLPIHHIFINPYNHLVWVFTGNAFYVSSDGGISFRIPRRPVAIQKDRISSLRQLTMAFLGDSSIINFDFKDNPGLAVYIDDSLVINSDESPNSYYHYLISSLRLPVSMELTGVAAVVKEDKAFLAVGTKSQGLFYLDLIDTLWENLNRQTKVEGKLKEIITFPTVFDGSQEVGIGYQLSDNAKVTIRVFNYNMEKVRTLVEDVNRIGGRARSEDPQEDRWDGKDDYGNLVSTGLYYVLVISDKGERGWGKVIVTYGRN